MNILVYILYYILLIKTIMNTFTLNEIEVKVLNKLGLKKENLFEPKRLVKKRYKNHLILFYPGCDAVTYLSLRGYTADWATLKMSIFPEEWNIAFFISSDTGEINPETNKKIYDDRQVTSAEFKEELATRKESMSESIDSL